MVEKIPVGILGGRGVLGEHYRMLLEEHPWFELIYCPTSDNLDKIEEASSTCQLIFSALPNEQAKLYEERYAAAGLGVISSSSYHRKNPDVPVIIPEINQDHLQILEEQQKKRGWTDGFIVCKPNCSIQSYLLPLTPLHKRFQVKKIMVTMMQAISGAGYSTLPSYTIQDNIIPYIADEEEKSEEEPLKIWGKIENEQIQPLSNLPISAHCNRVPVLNGHTACVSVEFARKPTEEEILEAWSSFEPLSLPSAPRRPIIYRKEIDRPQSRLDREAEKGMAVTVGRVRPCPVLDYRFVGLSHNAIRGGAGGGILIAEMIYAKKRQFCPA